MKKRRRSCQKKHPPRRKVQYCDLEKTIKKTQVAPAPVVDLTPPPPMVIIQNNMRMDVPKGPTQIRMPAPPQKKIEWEKPTQNYINNYGPTTMYANFTYKNMNFEQITDARKKAFIREQNGM